MIDYELAIKTSERLIEIELAANNIDKNFIKDFLHQYCHYLTQELAVLHESQYVRLFYLEHSQQIIHSALELTNNNVMDAAGIRDYKQIEAFHNASNSITGVYQSDGQCLSSLQAVNEFNPDFFYHSNIPTNLRLKKRVKFWFEHVINVKDDHIN